MGWIIGGIIATIILFIALGMDLKKDEWHFQPRQFASILGFLVIFIGIVAKVPANSVGIKYSPFGGVSEETLSEGFHVKNIFDKIYKISTEVQSMEVSNLTTQTKDAQYLNSTLDIKYRVSNANAYLVFKQFRTLDNLSKSLIVPTTQRVMELVTTKYNVIDVLGEKRADVYSELIVALTEEFAKYGVEFYSISITDMDAGEALESAITAEAVAKKAVETAEQELLRVETEAKQIAVQAQAEQDASRIKAETLVIEAEAQSEANRLLTESLDDLILRKLWIEKWNGLLPDTIVGEGSTSLILGK